MKMGLSFPTDHLLQDFLSTKNTLSPTYEERKDTLTDFSQKRLSVLGNKYDYDENRILLGRGEKIFDQAKMAIRQWRMFPEAWTSIYPKQAPLQAGQQVAVLFRILGLWWWNSSEIIYTIDEPYRFGFAYGTLPGHVETGEELFLVEIDDQEKVWYVIKAFSRPAYWLIRWVYPFARSQQKRFVRDSLQQMKTMIGE